MGRWRPRVAGDSTASGPTEASTDEPLTGAFRRTALLLVVGLAVAFLIAVATMSGRRTDPCPDGRYGCVELGPGEPMGVGTLFPEGDPGREGVEALVRSREEVLDHRLEMVPFDGECSAHAAARAAREFATQPREGPAVVAVVGESCPEAETTAARILDDSGITFVSVVEPSDVPRTVAFHLGWAGSASSPDRAAFDVTRTILQAVARVAVEEGGDLLVPRTQLRDALLELGLSRAP
jgi:hypothetical protein